MDATSGPDSPSHRQILAVAWPVILANVATPLLGLVDTAVIGHLRPAAALGAIAVGSLILNFIYWAFGFLRMGTTGFVAQAHGANNVSAVRIATLRSTGLGLAIGILLIALQTPLSAIALHLMAPGPEVLSAARDYVSIRIWGAPATLVSYAVVGTLIGLGRTRTLLALQILLNGLNLILDVVLAGVLDWGVAGIAIGTLIAEWVAAIVGAVVIWRQLTANHETGKPIVAWREIVRAGPLLRTFRAHADIMIRTLGLLWGFAWFTRTGAQLGDTILAANHVLLGLISFSAFFLDGFAFTTESFVGRAKGRGDRPTFDRVVRRTSQWAAATALALGLLFTLGGTTFIAVLTDLPGVRTAAAENLPAMIIYVVVGVAAFQLDGIFIGCTATRAMRNASIVSVVLFMGLCHVMLPICGNQGLWIAFNGFVLFRAATLAVAFPGLRNRISAAS